MHTVEHYKEENKGLIENIITVLTYTLVQKNS